MNYYSFHIGDYASHTRGLSLIEDLAYRRILDLYYLSEKPLIGEYDIVARKIGMAEYAEQIEYVLITFFDHTPDGFINKRADEEIAKYHAKQEQAVKAGKASAEKRFNTRSAPVQPTNNQEPITKNHIKDITPVGVSDLVFNDYLKIRKAQKKPWTPTAQKLMENEAKKAGISLQDAMEMCCARGWVGFKAEWANSQNSVSKKEDDKSWMFSNEGIVAKANELGLRSEGLSYQQLKDKCLYVMTNRALQ